MVGMRQRALVPWSAGVMTTWLVHFLDCRPRACSRLPDESPGELGCRLMAMLRQDLSEQAGQQGRRTTKSMPRPPPGPQAGCTLSAAIHRMTPKLASDELLQPLRTLLPSWGRAYPDFELFLMHQWDLKTLQEEPRPSASSSTTVRPCTECYLCSSESLSDVELGCLCMHAVQSWSACTATTWHASIITMIMVFGLHLSCICTALFRIVLDWRTCWRLILECV